MDSGSRCSEDACSPRARDRDCRDASGDASSYYVFLVIVILWLVTFLRLAIGGLMVSDPNPVSTAFVFAFAFVPPILFSLLSRQAAAEDAELIERLRASLDRAGP